MSVKAKLRVCLYAGDVLVAESEDTELWQKVLAAIQRGRSFADEQKDGGSNEAPGASVAGDSAMNNLKNPIEKFARELGIEPSVIEGACAPGFDSPFIHLDEHCWESFKKNTPPRGQKSVSAISLAATLLCLWFKSAGIEGRPSPAQARAVLETIGVAEKNPSRSLKNCEWLQNRSGNIQMNPAKVSKAKTVAKAYCQQQPIE